MKASAHEGLQRGRTTPKIIVHRGGRSLRTGYLADRSPPLVAQSACELDFAQLAGVQIFNRFAHPRVTARLGAGLHDTLVLPCSLNDTTPLGNIVANGLFHINILSGLDGPNGDQRMPMIGGGYGNSVNVGVGQ